VTLFHDVVASGWPAFPLRTRTKIPAIRSAHPVGDPRRGVCKGECGNVGHGCWDATTSIQVLQGWTNAYPDCNWGLHAGAASLFIIDVDNKKPHPDNGENNWREHCAREGHIPTFTVRTPSGGWHFYYRLPADLTVTTRALLGPGIDIRSTGGYVVVPGSYVDDGDVQGTYAVAENLPVAPLPAWIERLYRDDQAARTAMRRAATTVDPASAASVRERLLQIRDEIAELPDGNGANGASRLAYMAGQYVGAGQADPDDTIALLISAIEDWDWRRPGDRIALERQIAKGVHDGMSEPRTWEAAAPHVAWFPGQDILDPKPTPPGYEPRGAADTPQAVASGKPQLDITHSGEALDRLKVELGAGRLSGLYLRDGRVMHTPRMGAEGYIPPRHPLADDGPAQIRAVDKHLLGATVDNAYQVIMVTPKGAILPKHLPVGFAERLLGAASAELCPNLSEISGVTHTPIVRPEGTVLDEPGYDTSTQLLYLPTAGMGAVKVPEMPSPGEIAAAREFVLTPIREFPFVSTVHRANWLGMALTPLIRTIVPPPYQLGIIEASNPGSGKSYLLAILRLIHSAAVRSALPATNEEWSKVVPALLSATTAPIIAFDNVRGVIKSSYLEGLLTLPEIADRVLGRNDRTVRLANDRLWIMTGNNATYGGDLARRILRCEIDPGVPDPQRRRFDLNPVAWVAKHRAAYLSALLTLVRAWAMEGQPVHQVTRSDDYATWIGTVRGIQEVAGFDMRDGLFADDGASAPTEVSEDDAEWGVFLQVLEEHFGHHPFTGRDIASRIEGDYSEETPGGRIARELVPGMILERARTGHAERSIGRWLSNREGRWVANLCIRNVGKVDIGPQKHSKLYRVERFVG
jgi:hypothetical protein